VSRLIWVYALGMLAFMSLNGVLVLYLERVFDFNEATIGWFYLYVAGVSLLMRAVLLGPIVRLIGEVRTLQVGALLIGCGLLTIPLADNLLGLALVALFMPVGTSLLFPATTSQISQRFKIGETGQGLGVQQAFGGMARWLGPIWSTLAFERLGITSPFWIAGGAMMAVWLFSMQIRRPPRGGTEVAQTLDELEATQAEEAG
jgi:DHA1 family tetracycline resistance protein-like MFS transporter